MLHDACDYTPYEGLAVTGWPVLTMVRGVVVVRDGKLVGEKGFGEHLARDRSPLAARPSAGSSPRSSRRGGPGKSGASIRRGLGPLRAKSRHSSRRNYHTYLTVPVSV